MKRLLAALALAFTLTAGSLALDANPSFAQDTEDTEEGSPEDRAASFQSVSGPQVEDVPGGALMIGAYGVAWLLVVLYLWRLASLQRKTAAEVDALRHTVENATGERG